MKKTAFKIASVCLLSALLISCDSNDDDKGEGTAVGDCTDRADNDGDGLFDCFDPGCKNSPDCTQPKDQGVEQPITDGTPPPVDTQADQAPPPDIKADTKLTCTPTCGVATIQYPDNAKSSPEMTHCCNGTACGVITTDNRSDPTKDTLVSCDVVCAQSTYKGKPMVCAARGGSSGSGSSKSFSYCKGGTTGGYALVYPGSSQSYYSSLSCSKKQPWNSKLRCSCEAAP